MKNSKIVIIGSGPAGLGAAFQLVKLGFTDITLFEKRGISSGGLRNDCKQNYTYPVGFSTEYWSQTEAEKLLKETEAILKPAIEPKTNIDVYKKRAERLDVNLIDIRQAHVGTDKSVELINSLIGQLKSDGVNVLMNTAVNEIVHKEKYLLLDNGDKFHYDISIVGPGRAGFSWLQDVMNQNGIEFHDNIVDIGVRLETREDNYPIVRDYYDPKFIFPMNVRTFCTNSGSAHIVKEKYDTYWSVNGHSFSAEKKPNNLTNFAVLKTINLTDPVVSGQEFGRILGEMAMQLSGGQPMMQRIGDFRTGRRSKLSTFNDDLYDFEPTLKDATPGDVSLAAPAKILRSIWSSLKQLDTIVPGILHPSTIIYYPEIKTYANRPHFIDLNFAVLPGLYMIGDGAGTSRGITGAWASGIRCANGIGEISFAL
jgi:uncharacterized FAD-dependent dehydrogenase